MDESYIKIYRGLLDWEWYSDTNTKVLFIHLLLKANWKDGNFRGGAIKRGQLFTSINHLAEQLDLSGKAIRLSLNKLKRTNEIDYKGQANGTLVTVVKYSVYQQFEISKGKQRANEGANEGQTEGKRGATIEEGNKGIKEKEKGKKCFFAESLFFDKVKFKEAIPDWNRDKLLFYYEAAIRYSNEGHKYIDWIAAVKAWSRKAELEGKIKFDTEKKQTEAPDYQAFLNG